MLAAIDCFAIMTHRTNILYRVDIDKCTNGRLKSKRHNGIKKFTFTINLSQDTGFIVLLLRSTERLLDSDHLSFL